MREEAGVTTVDVDTYGTITGRLARFGRGGMIKDIANRLLRDFSACLAQTIEAKPQEATAPAPPGPAPGQANPRVLAFPLGPERPDQAPAAALTSPSSSPSPR